VNAVQAVQLVDPSVTVPYSFQESIGVARQLGSWSVQADFVNWRVYDQWIRTDDNLTYNPTTGFNQNPNTSGRPDSRFTTILRFKTPGAAGAYGNNLQIGVHKRLTHNVSVDSGYTLSKSKDSSTGDFFVPNNQYDIKDEWSNAIGDQRHTFNVNGVYHLPFGFQFSSLYRFGSGAAYAVSASGSPFGNAPTNNRTFLSTTHVYNNPAYNYASTAPGYLTVKRNSFYGRPIERVDARLSNTIPIYKRYKVMTAAEAFNLFNHSNYGAYNTALTSSTFGTPAQDTTNVLSYSARMIQLSIRLDF